MIFQRYDAVRSHATKDDGPAPWMPEEDRQHSAQPSQSQSQKPAPPTQITGTLTLVSNDDGKVTLDRPGPPQQVLTDATSDRPREKPPSWQHDRIEQMQEELGRRKMLTDLSRTNRGNFTRDGYGMQKACENTPNSGTYYDPKTRTMYIRGSQTPRDWYDDFFRVPA
jgi:hypothetical protein